MSPLPRLSLLSRSLVLVALSAVWANAQQAGGSCLTSNGGHKGIFLRGEFGLFGSTELEGSHRSGPSKSYDSKVGVKAGLGYSLAPRVIPHLQLELSPATAEGNNQSMIVSVGPALTIYTPLANTFVTGHLSFSKLNALGGDVGSRWSLGIGKELLFADYYGIGLMGSYESGSWDEGNPSYPTWKLGGVELHLTITIS